MSYKLYLVVMFSSLLISFVLGLLAFYKDKWHICKYYKRNKKNKKNKK